MAQSPNLDDFVTIEQFIERSGGKFTMSQVRWLLRFRDENGLADAVTQVGRRLYINVPKFTEWLAKGAGRTAA